MYYLNFILNAIQILFSLKNGLWGFRNNFVNLFTKTCLGLWHEWIHFTLFFLFHIFQLANVSNRCQFFFSHSLSLVCLFESWDEKVAPTNILILLIIKSGDFSHSSWNTHAHTFFLSNTHTLPFSHWLNRKLRERRQTEISCVSVCACPTEREREHSGDISQMH